MTGRMQLGRPQGLAIRTLLVDDSYLVREGLRMLLSLTDAVDVVGSCQDAVEAKSAIDTAAPDVVVADIRMPPTFTDEGIRLADDLRRSHPEIGVVILSQEGNVDLAAQLLDDGATRRAYLLKDRVHDLDHLVAAIAAVHRSECLIDPVLVQQLVSRHSPTPSPLDVLTPRQRELIADIAEGKSNAAIATYRHLSLRAVEKHVSEIFVRLGLVGDADVSRRVRATLLYLEAVGR